MPLDWKCCESDGVINMSVMMTDKKGSEQRRRAHMPLHARLG